MGTITKRGNVYQVRIRQAGFPQLTETFSRRDQAMAWMHSQESALRSGTWKDPRRLAATTLAEILDQYAQEVVPGKRGAEVEAVRIRTLKRDRHLSNRTLQNLTAEVLASWRDRRLAAGAAGSTVNRELNVLSAVINWARTELGLPMPNPVAEIRRPTQPLPRARRLTKDEEARLMRSLEDHAASEDDPAAMGYRTGTRNPWIKAIVQLALSTGMRRGEILSMQWSHVDLERRVVHLPLTKNGQSRNVPLSSSAAATLVGVARNPDEPRVFPVTPDAVKRAFARACLRGGISDLHFHDLRHEAITRMSKKLPNLIELAAVSGHRDVRMLARYYHPDAAELARKLG